MTLDLSEGEQAMRRIMSSAEGRELVMDVGRDVVGNILSEPVPDVSRAAWVVVRLRELIRASGGGDMSRDAEALVERLMAVPRIAEELTLIEVLEA